MKVMTRGITWEHVTKFPSHIVIALSDDSCGCGLHTDTTVSSSTGAGATSASSEDKLDRNWVELVSPSEK